MNHPISLASGVLPEFGPIETIDAAVAGGFDGVGLWIEPGDWTDATTRAARERLAGTDLALIDVEVVWIKPGPFDETHLRIIDVGAELGAANVLVVASDPDLAAATAKYARLCAYGGERGLRIALEFGIFTDVKTIQQALRIIEDADDPAAALLIDPIHADRSGATSAHIAAVPRRLLPYAQFCDATADRPDAADFDAIIRDAVDLRMQVGEGVLPLDDVLAALPEGIPLSIELRSEALRNGYPDPGERAKAVATATRRFLKRAAG